MIWSHWLQGQCQEVAARTVKRVSLELGGKSPNIILDDADLESVVPASVKTMMLNSGQSCNAPSRMLVPNSRMDEAIEIARETAAQVAVGDPDNKTAIGVDERVVCMSFRGIASPIATHLSR